MTDPEREGQWAELVSTWRRAGRPPAPPDQLRQKIREHNRRLGLHLVVELGVSVAVPLIVFDALRHHPEVVSAGVAVAIVAHLLVVWTFVLWNRRGIRGPVAESARSYLELGIDRCRRQLRSIRFVVILLFVETSLVGYYLVANWRAELRSHLVALHSPIEAGIGLGLLVVFSIWVARRWLLVRRELAMLSTLLEDATRAPIPGR